MQNGPAREESGRICSLTTSCISIPSQRGRWDKDVPVKLHLEEHESFHELGRALNLPFPKLAYVESAPLSPYHDGRTN